MNAGVKAMLAVLRGLARPQGLEVVRRSDRYVVYMINNPSDIVFDHHSTDEIVAYLGRVEIYNKFKGQS